MTLRNQQKLITKKRIAQAALRTFAKNGFTNSSTLTIAHQAHVAHGTIFTHFPTREKLIGHVIQEFGESVSRRLHELAQSGKGMREVLAAHLQGLREYEDFYRRLILESASLPSEAALTLISIQSAISLHLSTAAQHDLKNHIIRPLPMHLLFNTWIGLIHHYLINREYFSPKGSVLTQYGSELLEHYLGLLSPGKEEPHE